MELNDVTLLSSNEDKLKEFRRLLNSEIKIRAGDDILEIMASSDLVALFKAYEAGERTIVEDTTLEIDGEEVVDIKFRLDEINKEGFSQKAKWITYLALHKDGVIKLFAGEVEGMLKASTDEEKSFGFDKNFFPEGSHHNLAELEKMGKKDDFSARKKAVDRLLKNDFSSVFITSKLSPWTGSFQGYTNAV